MLGKNSPMSNASKERSFLNRSAVSTAVPRDACSLFMVPTVSPAQEAAQEGLTWEGNTHKEHQTQDGKCNMKSPT